MKAYKSWIFEQCGAISWSEPTKYFFNEEQAKIDNKERLAECKEKNPNGWWRNGVDEIEIL